MKKFIAKFIHEFSVEFESESTETAEVFARNVIAEFPEGTVKLVSITLEGEVVPDEIKLAVIEKEVARVQYPGGIDDLPVGA